MHAIRLRVRGDVNYEHRGANSERYRGNEVTYGGIHQRLRDQRGPATEHLCIECGVPAQQWAYDHSGIEERIDVAHKGSTFSTDINHYVPMCRRCHRRVDTEVVLARRADRATPSPIAKLTIDQVRAIRNEVASGVPMMQVARAYGLGRSTVAHIRNREVWKWVT